MDVHSICPVCPFYMGPLNKSPQYLHLYSISKFIYTCFRNIGLLSFCIWSRIPVQEPPRHRIRSWPAPQSLPAHRILRRAECPPILGNSWSEGHSWAPGWLVELVLPSHMSDIGFGPSLNHYTFTVGSPGKFDVCLNDDQDVYLPSGGRAAIGEVARGSDVSKTIPRKQPL